MLFTAVSECAHILLHPSLTLLNIILISPLRSSMRTSTLCCCGWPTQRADATQWTLVTQTHPSKPYSNTIARWRWADIIIFLLLFTIWHIVIICDCCGFAGSAGGAAVQAGAAGLPPDSVVAAPAWGGGRRLRWGPGEAPRDRQQTEAAAETGGAGPRHPETTTGEGLLKSNQQQSWHCD